MTQFILNDTTIATPFPPGEVLLDFIRYQQALTGTKIGCREGDCGACTVLVGTLQNGRVAYRSATSCLMPLGNAHGKHIVTIEGINRPHHGNGPLPLNPVQEAMAEEGATQCGFCTPGFVVSLTGFCLSGAPPHNARAAVDGNICRCTGYKSIERAADRVGEMTAQRQGEDAIAFAVAQGVVPAYFTGVTARLEALQPSANATHTSAATIVLTGGGTDLYVQKHDEMKEAAIRFLFDDLALKQIRQAGKECWIGPSATVTDLLESPIMQQYFPGLGDHVRLVSSTPIRNMATIAGNFINASPIGDLTIFFLALDAQLELSDDSNTRTLPLRQLYKGYKTLEKNPEEYISQIRFTLPVNGTVFHFEKVSKRTNLDIASVNAAICLKMEKDRIREAGLSAGGVGPVPLFLRKTSAFLKDKTISETLVHEAIAIALTEIAPISDARGSAAYKRLLLGQLIKAHFLTLFPQLDFDRMLSIVES